MRYPTMKTCLVRVSDGPGWYVDATVSVDNKPLVVLDSEDDMTEDINLTPAEAERVARALNKAASVARAKKSWEKQQRHNRHPAPSAPTTGGRGRG